MSIYEGTIGEAEYADGRDQGRRAAVSLSEDGMPSWQVVGEAAAREDLATAYSPRSRAFYIGWLRGFREVAR